MRYNFFISNFNQSEEIDRLPCLFLLWHQNSNELQTSVDFILKHGRELPVYLSFAVMFTFILVILNYALT